MKDNRSINITSGVSLFTKKGFCTIEVDGRAIGQLDPAEVRTMALHWIEAAEAAEMDAMVVSEMTDPEGLNLSIEVAAQFVKSLRRRRDPR
jgi:hypothetical protein